MFGKEYRNTLDKGDKKILHLTNTGPADNEKEVVEISSAMRDGHASERPIVVDT